MDFTHFARALPPCQPDIPEDVANRRMFAWITTTLVLVLAVVSYGARIWARKKSYQPLKWDDFLMGLGLLITFEPAICEYLLMANGLGHHVCNVPADQRQRFLHITFALQRANQPALLCIKLSILAFYMRLFPSKRFGYFVWANVAYTIIWAVVSWVVNLTVCSPIAYYYDKTIKGGTCRNQVISGTANGAFSLLGDVFILALPLPIIWGLQVNMRRRIALIGIFLLGTLSCVSSAIRIAALVNFTPLDGTYSQVYASGWTFMEMGFAVIGGNLPLLKPLFESFFRLSTGSTNKSKSNSSFPTNGSLSGPNVSGKSRKFTSSKRDHLDADGFERISDDGSAGNTQPNSIRDIELGDRTILVKKDVTITTDPARPEHEKEFVNRIQSFRH
ncbi:uncharacterized protein BP5553_00122 [Venustampulla echinocandica]|uniref:Rhodopsin domain-containing protein n=1 Tax=Venustampulla echinocandica TaxID=2656787 RepID=A0A370TX99_9HELO|nr:uncharacterized protein BP5553_00122 [Venustampulla echinocandica]RDL40143.1 hypothetical protein BP5553_00122 [Venustampulla echinocandica]